MRSVGAVVVATAVLAISAAAVMAAAASSYTISVLSDRTSGTEGLTEKQIQQRNQVFDWMERDMVSLLTRRGGYDAAVITSRDAFQPGPGKYLLVTRIVRYNPGAKAARMIVGFGAGAASLDTHFELFGEGKEPLISRDHGVGSGREWVNCCRKLNEQMLTAVKAALSEAPKAK
jgi:hypothetical protein